MKRNILCAAMVLLAGSLMAADKDDVSAAIAKLAAADSYSWKVTVTNVPPPGGGGGGGQRRGGGRGGFGNMTGKAEKDGLMYVTMPGRGGGMTEAYVKAGKGAIKAADADWASFDEVAAGDPGPATFMATRLKTQKAAAGDAQDWLEKAKSITKTDDVYTGALTEEGIKSTVFAPPGGDPPEITDPKGTVKFWIKDGMLIKYERNVQYKRTFNDNPIDINQTTTVDFSDVGATKIAVPDDVKKKMS